jgi:hypothetical protein
MIEDGGLENQIDNSIIANSDPYVARSHGLLKPDFQTLWHVV